MGEVPDTRLTKREVWCLRVFYRLAPYKACPCAVCYLARKLAAAEARLAEARELAESIAEGIAVDLELAPSRMDHLLRLLGAEEVEDG